jgi:uncharacterized membrane protein YoaK (UPF0700 family)
VSGTTALASLLAAVAGYVDAFGYRTYGTFLSFMSGNTTIAGFSAAKGKWTSAVPSIVAILGFVAGVVAGGLFSGQPRRRIVAAVPSLLLVAAMFVAVDATARMPVIAVVSCAMGLMNSAVTRIGGQAVNVTFVTGTLTRLGRHVASALRRQPLEGASNPSDTHVSRALELAAVWGSFLAGAFAGGVATDLGTTWMLAPPIVVLGGLAWRERSPS